MPIDSNANEVGGPALPSAPKLPGKPSKKVQATTSDKPRRKWRDFVLWGVIVILAIGAGLEFRAQMAFRKTLALCNAAMENVEGRTATENKRMTFDAVKSALPPDPVYTKELHSYVPSGCYTWSWQGLRSYKVHLFVNLKDGTLWDVTSEP